MPKIAYFECARCGQRLSAESPQSMCPADGGPLYLRYDTDELRRTARRERPAELAAASAASLGMWRYADVLPGVAPVMPGAGWTPMLPSRRYPNLFVKDEGSHTAGTSQARGLALAVAIAKQYGFRHIAMSSAGSDAAALAACAAAAGISAHIAVPQDVPLAPYLETMLYGADVTVVDGTIAECATWIAGRIRQQREQRVAEAEMWFDLSARQEPFRTEGQKTLGYEIVEQLGWKYPDAVLLPPSDGAGLMAMAKAFDEMEQLGWVSGKRPRLYVTQLSDAAADVLSDEHVSDCVRRSGGDVIACDRSGALTSLQEWAEEEGLLLSFEGAAAAAGYSKLLQHGELGAEGRVVLVNPEAASKQTDELARALRLHRPGSLPRSLPVGGIITPV